MIQVPRDLQREIFDFAGYKLRNGVYMKQLNINPELYELLLERPSIENGKVTIDLYCKKYHRDIVMKVIEINQKRKSYISYYAIDFDDSRYKYKPSVPW